MFCGKATETLLTLRSKLSGAGVRVPPSATEHETGYEVWPFGMSKMGNYGTTYPQMGKNEYTGKATSTTKEMAPRVLLTLSERMPVKAFLKFSLASSISCSWVAFSFISRRRVAVGRLHHGVEVVCGPPVHLSRSIQDSTVMASEACYRLQGKTTKFKSTPR